MTDFGIEQEDLSVLLNPEIREYDLRTGEQLEHPYCEISIHGRDRKYLSRKDLGGYRFNSTVRYNDISVEEFLEIEYPTYVVVFESELPGAELQYPVFD
ncbi:hypothetical protein ACFO0N_15205 [Halobium salinum]|uniref:Uncharacterized protein n=1 Tax=Halobium salinum TaxID=1364940 RepID=A0ABD5PEU6_9EURY|nr:hypothetical protein [Halobium salinum]